MRRRTILLSPFAVFASLKLSEQRCYAADADDFRAAMKNCASALASAKDYKADPYIRAAQILQKMGKDDACRLLQRPGIEAGKAVSYQVAVKSYHVVRVAQWKPTAPWTISGGSDQ